jgi:hypothetical protein
MDPKLLAILKKSKAVEAKTNAVYGESGGPNTHGGSKIRSAGGLMDQIGGIDGTALLTAEEAGVSSGGGGNMMMETSAPATKRLDSTNPMYEERVKNSGLPSAVAEAMLKTPIPQPSFGGAGVNVTEDDIRELNPNYGKVMVEDEDPYYYSDEDEHDLTEQRHVPTRREPKTRRTQVNPKQVGGSGISEKQLKRMIAEEIARVLPNVVEKYFDNKIIKENTRLMKVLLKESRGRK